MKEYLLVCKVLKPLGLNGEMKVYSYTTFKDIRYKKGNALYIKDNNEYKALTIKSHYSKGGNIEVISFKDYEDINLIAPFIGQELYALKDEKLLNKNEFYYSDLINLKVLDEDNNELGKVISVEEFPAQITLKISKNLAKAHFFVPFNDFFVKKVDLENKEIIIHLIEGLTD